MAALAVILAACTPAQGMGCYPCCGVTSGTSAVAQSGHAGLGAAVLILVGAGLWKAFFGRRG